MSRRKKQALEKLRAQVEVARKLAGASLREKSVEELAEMYEGHQLGENINGWKNPYPSSDPRSLLLEYQLDFFHDRSRFKAQLASRQTGKDFTSEGEAVEDCWKNPKTDWMIAGPSERQSLDSLDQGKLWAEGFDFAIEDYLEEREGSTSETLLKSAEIIFANGSRMRAVPGKPNTVRGRSANVLLTEFDYFENPAETWRAILPSITNPLRGGEKKVRLVTTPNGAGSPMHKIWTKTDSVKMQWSRHLVTIYHAVLMGLPVDIDQIREALDDLEGFAQEYLCEFLDGANVLLPYDIIQMAESFEATEFADQGYWVNGSSNPIVLGIDFGRTHDPTVCWALEKVGDIWWTREVWRQKGMPTPEQQKHLSVRIKQALGCCFDYTGPGIGLGDYLVQEHQEWKPQEHKFGKIELDTFTLGFKRDIFPKLRRAFEAPTKIRIPVSVAIREDLHEMRQIIKNGEYNYTAPRTAEGHSDRCTALALAVRASAIFDNAHQFSATII